MARAFSVSSLHSDRVPYPALALAILLHALVVLALWWMSQVGLQGPRTEEAIEVTIEQPPPPELPKPAPAPPAPPPPLSLGLPPPAPLTSERPTQVPSAAQASKEAPAPQPPSVREPAPPQSEPPTQTLEGATAPPAKPIPPPQRPDPRQVPTALTLPRPPAAPSHAEEPSPSPFVNPADVYNRARISDNYLWQVARKLSGYRYQARTNVAEGTTVVRIVIARNGRLLDVAIARSSGVPEFDRGVLEGVRAGSPYTPLPPEIKGDQATFNLPLVSVNERR